MKGQKEIPPSTNSLPPKCPQQLWIDQAEIKNPEFHTGLPRGWQRTQVLSPSPAAFQGAGGTTTQTQVLQLGCRHPGIILTAMPHTHSYSKTFFKEIYSYYGKFIQYLNKVAQEGLARAKGKEKDV